MIVYFKRKTLICADTMKTTCFSSPLQAHFSACISGVLNRRLVVFVVVPSSHPPDPISSLLLPVFRGPGHQYAPSIQPLLPPSSSADMIYVDTGLSTRK